MTRLAPLLLCLWPAAPAAAAAAGGPPNVLVLIADDFGVEQYPAYGEGFDLPNTPVLDQLAQDGVLFRNAWAYPLCTPARASIQTGRYGFRTGVGSLMHFQGVALSHDEFVIPEMLDAGTDGTYAHGLFGKWHLSNDTVGGDLGPNLAGWSHFEGLGITNFSGYFDWIKIVNGVSSPSTTYVTTDAVDSTLAWIGDQSGPWLAYVGFVSPHNPLHAPPDDLHTVDLSTAGSPQADPRPYYKAMCEALDTEIGRLLEGLGDQRDNTVVIFLSDNGTQSQAAVAPHPSDQVKGTVYEGGVNVPLVVSGPPVAVPGSESEALVSTVDLFATIAELAGVDLQATMPPGTELDSISLVPYLADPAAPSQREVVYTELFSPNGPGAHPVYRRAARNATHKLIQRSTTPDELYDLEADPYEDVDLLQSPLGPEDSAAYQALRLAIADLLLPWPAVVHPYTCINPPESLRALTPEPTLGQNLVLEIDNPYGTQEPGSPTLLLFSLKADAAYPCGNVIPDYGMAGGGAAGESLIPLGSSTLVPGPLWGGPGAPAQIPISAPPSAVFLLERPVYFQGAILGAPGSEVAVGVTNGLHVQFGP